MKIAFVVGTRPNFVKVAPLISACKKIGIEYVLIHTGQHYDYEMSQAFFEDLKIPKPDVNLNVNSKVPKDLKKITSEKISNYLKKIKPDLTVVVGDSDATCAGAMGANLAKIKLAHVEAGLRSFYMSMPEECNRLYIDKVANYLFVTERSGLKNLKDAKAKGKVFFVGNVMIDTLIENLEKISSRKNKFSKNSYAIATLHRKSNVNEVGDLRESLEILNYVADKYIKIVLPIHPRTRTNILNEKLKLSKNIEVIEPLGYLSFQKLLMDCRFVLTDSGGLQDETTYYKIPCITMRENTERPITYRIGSSVLVGRNKKLVVKNVKKVLEGKFKKGKVPKFWDGKSSEKIIKIL